MQTLVIVLFCVLLFSNLSFSNNNPVPIPKKLTGNEVYTNREKINLPQPRSTIYPDIIYSDGSTIFRSLDIFTLYDIQSFGIPQEIWQDPLIPFNVHIILMYSETLSFTSRNCAYLFSNDHGKSWTNFGNVPSGFRSGFPSVSGTSTGAAIIGNQNNFNATPTRSKIYIDLGPGIGAFTEYDPMKDNKLYSKVLGIANGATFLTSDTNTQSYFNRLSTPVGWFSGYEITPGEKTSSYYLARASNGNIGHAYIENGGLTNLHDLFFRESTDDGLTWTNPIKIWDWSINTDSLGVLNDVSMVYRGNIPYIAFSTMKLTYTGFFPNLPSQIRVWCPNFNNGIPVIIADSSTVPFYPNKGNVADGYTSLCRPVIGVDNYDWFVCIAFNSTSGVYGLDSNSFYDIRANTLLYDGTVYYRRKLTPDNPRKDWRYVSMSAKNAVFGLESYFSLVAQSDSVPGSFVHSGTNPGWAEMVYIGTSFYNQVHPYIINYNSPAEFYLYDNFPNPFNPSTKIRFALPSSENVSLTVFDITGREIAKLVKGEKLTAGTYEVEFRAENLSSGIYFYTLQAGKNVQTKKMMLVK